MKNKFKYEVHKFVDYPMEKVPKKLLARLSGHAIYRDALLDEHLYNPDCFEEFKISEGEALSLSEEKFLNNMTELVEKTGSAYIRFIGS